MRRSVVLAVALASVAGADPLTQRQAGLIPADARFVFGIDFTRYEQSPLRMLYPAPLDTQLAEVLGPDGARQVRQVVVIAGSLQSNLRPLMIVSGPAAGIIAAFKASRAIPEAGAGFAALDGSTALVGDPDSVQGAIDRWNKPPAQCDVASAAKRLSETYDNWFIAIRPFENAAVDPSAAGKVKYRAAFVALVEEVRGGIRVGAVDELGAEVTLQSAEDALAVAAISRWVPGLIQMRSPYDVESQLAELAENISVVPSGNTVSVSFTLDESKLRDLVKSRTRPDDGGENRDQP